MIKLKTNKRINQKLNIEFKKKQIIQVRCVYLSGL